MPNWCFNRVKVWGAAKVLNNFKRGVKLGKSPFSFQKIKPMPDDLDDLIPSNGEIDEDLISRFGADNWYDWRLMHWGTKWDINANDIYIVEGPRSVHYSFDTAWGPPNGIYLELLEKYPDINISWYYREDGNQIRGYLQNENNIEAMRENKAALEFVRTMRANWKSKST
jgi:hypothetical protein